MGYIYLEMTPASSILSALHCEVDMILLTVDGKHIILSIIMLCLIPFESVIINKILYIPSTMADPETPLAPIFCTLPIFQQIKTFQNICNVLHSCPLRIMYEMVQNNMHYHHFHHMIH